MVETIGLERQDYPRGTKEKGTFVQPGAVFPPTEAVPNWTDSDSLTVSSTVIQLNAAFRSRNDYCLITVETATLRFWLDGTNPTASTGHEVSPGDELILETVDELQDIQFIRRDGTDGVLRCSFGNRL